VLAGEDVPSASDVDTRLKTAWANRQAIHDARQSLKPRLAAAKYEAGNAILQSPQVQKAHAELMDRIVQPLADVAKAWVELFGMQRELRAREIGFRQGICQTMPLDLFGPPNAHSALATFLLAAVEAGYLKASALPRRCCDGVA
jgi:hypothetical protein